jgi:dipeptidase E
VTDRHIVAMGGGGFSMDDPVLDRFVLDLTGADRPRVCFLATASGDSERYRLRFFEAFARQGCVASELTLFDRSVEHVDDYLLAHDVVYVGGGNTASMLAVWRRHGVDVALRGAWEAGVVLAGVSAGANCWFEASTTDSFLLGRADPLADGLGMLAGSFCPHYDSEPERRRRFHEHVASGALPAGFGADDFAAVHFADADVADAIASRPGASVYRVEREGDGAVEESLPVRRLT